MALESSTGAGPLPAATATEKQRSLRLEPSSKQRQRERHKTKSCRPRGTEIYLTKKWTARSSRRFCHKGASNGTTEGSPLSAISPPPASSTVSSHTSRARALFDLQQPLTNTSLQLLQQLQQQQQRRQAKRREKQQRLETQKFQESQQLQALQQRFRPVISASSLSQQVTSSNAAAAAMAAAALLGRLKASQTARHRGRDMETEPLLPAMVESSSSYLQRRPTSAWIRQWDWDSSSSRTSSSHNREDTFEHGVSNRGGAESERLHDRYGGSSRSRGKGPLLRDWSVRQLRWCLKCDSSRDDSRDEQGNSAVGQPPEQQSEVEEQQQQPEPEWQYPQYKYQRQQEVTAPEKSRQASVQSSGIAPSRALYRSRRSHSGSVSKSTGTRSKMGRRTAKDCGIQVSLNLLGNLKAPLSGLSSIRLTDSEDNPAAGVVGVPFNRAAADRWNSQVETPEATAGHLSAPSVPEKTDLAGPSGTDGVLQCCPMHKTSTSQAAAGQRRGALNVLEFPSEGGVQQGMPADGVLARDGAQQYPPVHRQRGHRRDWELWHSADGTTAPVAGVGTVERPEEPRLHVQQPQPSSPSISNTAGHQFRLLSHPAHPSAEAVAATASARTRGIPLVFLMREKYPKWQRRRTVKSPTEVPTEQYGCIVQQPLPFLLGREDHQHVSGRISSKQQVTCSGGSKPGSRLFSFNSEPNGYRDIRNSTTSLSSLIYRQGHERRGRSRRRNVNSKPVQNYLQTEESIENNGDPLQAQRFDISSRLKTSVQKRQAIMRFEKMEGTCNGRTPKMKEGSGLEDWEAGLVTSRWRSGTCDRWLSAYRTGTVRAGPLKELKLGAVPVGGYKWKREPATTELTSERPTFFQPALHCSIASLAPMTSLSSVSLYYSAQSVDFQA